MSKLAGRRTSPVSSGFGSTRVAVLGGGLAGLSAARSLIEMGFQVSLIEKRPFLGGRAFSFYSHETDSEVDNGQHVFMGCCTYYIDFVRALGAYCDATLQDSLHAEVVLDGKRGTLSSMPFLGPLHLMPSFLKYPHLGISDKIRAAYGLVRVGLTDRRKNSPTLDSETFYNWLKRHQQPERAIENFWNLVILPTLNDDVRSVSADMALKVIKEGLLKRPGDAAIGYARVGLSSLAGLPGQRFIEERGGSVLLRTTVRSLLFDSDRVCGVQLSDGSSLRADAYVSALPHDILLDCLPTKRAADPFFASVAELQSAPIVGVHLWYDRHVMEEPFVAFINSPIQWVFNRSLIQGNSESLGQHVCISLSGAWQFIDRPKEELRELFEQEMERLFPSARGAAIQKSLIIKQPNATFRSVPGVSRLRPAQETPIQNLFLAGDWTDTDWPSTMEGAVRSGVYAANAIADRVAG